MSCCWDRAKRRQGQERNRLQRVQPDEQDASFFKAVAHHLSTLNSCADPFPGLAFGVTASKLLDSTAFTDDLLNVGVTANALGVDMARHCFAIYPAFSRQAKHCVQRFTRTVEMFFRDALHGFEVVVV